METFKSYNKLFKKAISTETLSIEELRRLLNFNPNSFRFVRNKTYELCMEAFNLGCHFLKFVKEQEQTPEMCIAAVKRKVLEDYFVEIGLDDYDLKFVKEQTTEICIEAVRSNFKALEFVKEQTPELCLEAVRNDGNALRYVKEQTTELCLGAVSNCSWALKYVKEQTPEICIEAVKNTGFALEYVKEQTTEICVEAVKEDSLAALKYVKKPFKDMYQVAIGKYFYMIKDVLEEKKSRTYFTCIFCYSY